MPNQNNIELSSHERLKIAIAKTFGRNIRTSGECNLLSADIYAKVSYKLNSNTLRRIFGLVKSDHFQSITTLDILSKYCGFSCFDEFVKLKGKNSGTNQEDLSQESILKYLTSLFSEKGSDQSDDKKYFHVVKETIFFLKDHPQLIDTFQKEISKTKCGQDYYFEQFINLDNLNSFYGEGLHYYLLEKQTVEGQIFGHSLLCLKNWLTENNSELARQYEKLNKFSCDGVLNPLLSGHFLAAQILYADGLKLPVDEILIQAKIVHGLINQVRFGNKIQLFLRYETIICPILLMTGHFREALFYVNYRLNNIGNSNTSLQESFDASLNLYSAIILFKTGDEQKARQLHAHMNPSDFYFLSKKFDTILFYILDELLTENIKNDSSVECLILETGFTKMNTIKDLLINKN